MAWGTNVIVSLIIRAVTIGVSDRWAAPAQLETGLTIPSL